MTARFHPSRFLAGNRWWVPVLLAASLAHAWMTFTRLDATLYFDALHTYLPLAREFMASGRSSVIQATCPSNSNLLTSGSIMCLARFDNSGEQYNNNAASTHEAGITAPQVRSLPL